MQFGIIGSGSWATAIAKILTDNGNTIHWWIRNEEMIGLMQKRKHNPQYLSSALCKRLHALALQVRQRQVGSLRH